MMNLVKFLKSVLLLLMLSGTSSLVWAQTFEGAVAKANNGNFAGALKDFRVLAKQGNKDAHMMICLLMGEVISVPAEEVAQSCLKSAQGGDVHAQKKVAALLASGEGFNKADPAAAFPWFLKAAQSGDVDAQMRVGAHYYEGSAGVKKNIVETIKWFEKAAAQGQETAKQVIPELYAKAGSEEKDPAAAFQWFLKAAQSGDADYQAKVGAHYYYGSGGAPKKDVAESRKWLGKAAAQGHKDAKKLVAMMDEHAPDGETAGAALINVGMVVSHDGRQLPVQYRTVSATNSGGSSSGILVQRNSVYVHFENVPVTAWSQESSATVWANFLISWVKTSSGVFQFKVCRGLPFIRRAISLSSV